MKKLLFTISFIFLGLVLSGCDIFSPIKNQDDQMQNDLNKTIEEDKIKSKEALISFFKHLNNQDFEKALLLFELDGFTYSWEGLENFSMPEERNDRVIVLKNYCQATGTCLKAEVIEIENQANDTYNLIVQFTNNDGSSFILGPCCGATEEEMPSQDKFNFKVKKINNTYKVITPPLYVP